MAGDQAAGRRGGSESRPRGMPLLEWIVGALGAALVLGTVGFLVYQAVLGQGTSPPDVRLVAEEVVELRNGYLVRFRVLNEGRSTAAQLSLEGELTGDGGEAVETSETTLDYLPGRSEREGGLFFTRDPRAFDLRLRPKGYVKP